MSIPVVSIPSRSARRGVVGRLLRDPLGLTSILVVGLIFLACLAADLLSPWNPNATDLSAAFLPPGGSHALGTDGAGRDVLARLLYGGRATFAAGALAAAVALVAGVPAGLLAGYHGKAFDIASSWVADMLLALPGIIVLLAARAAFGPSVWISMTLFGLMFSPGVYRVVRSSVRGVRNEPYLDAARVTGLSDARIVARHVVFVVRGPIIIQAALIAGIAIGVQAGLEFLGLGDPGTPSWGMMLSDGFRNVYLTPLLLLWPAVAIALVTASFAVFGNALRDALEGDATRTTRRMATRTSPAAEVRPVADDVLVSVQELAIEYPGATESVRVVDGVTLDVRRGEVLGLVGESGSGKTQTAFALLGLLPSAATIATGSIVIEGVDVVDHTTGRIDERRMSTLRGRRIAYVPQEPLSNLDPAFTIGYQLTRPLVRVTGLSRSRARERALDLLADVGIRDPKATFAAYPHEISGGMAQRVLIAGAVSSEPELLVADEPTTALDVTVQAEVLDILRGLTESRGMTILLVTHNFGVVADLCDRVAVMSGGRIVETAPVRDVLAAPRDPYTQRLIAATLSGKPPRTPLLSEGER